MSSPTALHGSMVIVALGLRVLELTLLILRSMSRPGVSLWPTSYQAMAYLAVQCGGASKSAGMRFAQDLGTLSPPQPLRSSTKVKHSRKTRVRARSLALPTLPARQTPLPSIWIPPSSS